MNTVDISTLRFADADGFYEALLQCHDACSAEQSQLLNAQLVLLLANQVADPAVLQRCLDAARASLPSSQESTP